MFSTTIYNKIGQGYNHTRKADPYISGRLFDLLGPRKNKTYLDIGCGTGNYTMALTKMGIMLTGIDPSDVMLEEARNKSEEITWIRGSAEDIPLPENSIDGAIATLTIHHWQYLEKGFAEISRVLKAGSLFVIFSYTAEQEQGYWFNHFFPEMMKKCFKKAISLDAVKEAANKSGMDIIQTEKYFVQEDLLDLFGYSGKHDPERYFDPIVRNGISSFSTLADEDEVETGLRKLRECIDSGQFETIKKHYDNDNGDYLFMVLKKMQVSK